MNLTISSNGETHVTLPVTDLPAVQVGRIIAGTLTAHPGADLTISGPGGPVLAISGAAPLNPVKVARFVQHLLKIRAV